MWLWSGLCSISPTRPKIVCVTFVAGTNVSDDDLHSLERAAWDVDAGN
jgi:hypothetical protein